MSQENYNSYYTPRKVVIGKHWKRPKPKVYDCNVRDVERFYQESYKDYLEAKDYAKDKASRGSIERDRDLEYKANNFIPEYRRTGSYLDSRDDESNPYTSRAGASGSSYSRQYSNDSGSGEQRSFRASSLTAQRDISPDKELENINERLERLRKLREELGLPSEAGKVGSGSSFSSTSTVSKSTNLRASSPVAEAKQSRFLSTEQSQTSSSSRGAGNRSRALDSSLDRGTDRYSSKNESKYSSLSSNADDAYGKQNGSSSYTSSYDKKSSALRSTNDDIDTPSSYTRKARNKVSFDADDDFKKYSPSASSTSTRNFESKSASSGGASSYNGTLDIKDDDDEIRNIRKKFPSSEEIMERLKKLDVDM